MTGGPGNAAAEVSYPDHLPDGDPYVMYNFHDTVNVEWVSWAENSSTTTMQIYYWQPSFTSGRWRPLDRIAVAQNGSRAYTLDNVKDDGNGWYLGQWNLNFTRVDNNPTTGLTLSQAFNCTFDKSLPARTFKKGAAVATATPTGSSGSAASPTQAGNAGSGSDTGATPVPQPNNSTTTPGSDAAAGPVSAVTNNGLSGGAIAGIVIGIIAALAIGAAAAFLFLRRRKAVKAQVLDGPGMQDTPHPPPPGYTPYAAAKQPGDSGLMSASNAGYYAKSQPAIPQMAQQPTYTELPGHGGYPSTTTSHFAEMPASQPLRQELPG